MLTTPTNPLSTAPATGIIPPPPPAPGASAATIAWQNQSLHQMNVLTNAIHNQGRQFQTQQHNLEQMQTNFNTIINKMANSSSNTARSITNAAIQQQQKQKEFHKQLQSNKIKLACNFVCTDKLSHKEAETVTEQYQALLWFYEALLFAEKSEIGEYDTQYLIELVAQNVNL